MKKILVSTLVLIALGLLTFFLIIPVFQGRLDVSPGIAIGSYQVRWYGLILAAAILTSYFTARHNSWRFGISKEAVDDYAFWVVIAGIVGARVYHVLFNLNYYSVRPDEIYKIWHGGISIYGAVLSGLLFTYFYCRKKAFTFSQLFDLVALSVPLGQAIGRFGNFVNQEAYGTVTDLPWKMFVKATALYHHPAFLYEALANAAIFLILYKFAGKLRSGSLGLTYLALYSFVRFFIEGIRMDSFYVQGFRADQIVAFLIFVISAALLYKKQAAKVT